MFSLKTDLNSYWRSLLRILYPANCILCGIPLVLEETHLCEICAKRIEPIKAPTCLRCATPIPPYGNRYSTCSNCRSERPHYDRGFALVRYEDPVKTIFHQIKFEKKIWLLNIFSKLLERSSVPAETNGYDLIVPVPLDRSRERNRGFNQAAVIAQRLVRIHSASGFRMVKILKKKKRTLPQSQLRRQDRLNNLAGAFGIRKQGMARNKRILLVDDIFTTGSTMNECAKILKEDGAERVDFLAVARS